MTALFVGVNERPEDKQLPGLIDILHLPRDRQIKHPVAFIRRSLLKMLMTFI